MSILKAIKFNINKIVGNNNGDKLNKKSIKFKKVLMLEYIFIF